MPSPYTYNILYSRVPMLKEPPRKEKTPCPKPYYKHLTVAPTPPLRLLSQAVPGHEQHIARAAAKGGHQGAQQTVQPKVAWANGKTVDS